MANRHDNVADDQAARAQAAVDAGSRAMLLKGINHIALISKDIDAPRAFYSEVFDAWLDRAPCDSLLVDGANWSGGGATSEVHRIGVSPKENG